MPDAKESLSNGQVPKERLKTGVMLIVPQSQYSFRVVETFQLLGDRHPVPRHSFQ